jgi:hydroxyquinol 1,2-dioxygenase
MDGGETAWLEDEAFASLRAFEARLATLDPSRLREALAVLVGQLHQVLWTLRPSHDEFRAVIDFLTETGHYADARRQEWVLLADALGLSSAIEDINSPRPLGATPETGAGPFYRADTPRIGIDKSISRDGRGAPMLVTGAVTGLEGEPVGGATVEVWQANAEGLYENQEPDRQPEHNLRGRLTADAQGRFRFLSVKPGGYSLPADGPAGALLTRLGLPLSRPAHINLRVSAKGYDTLTTHIFDRADPAADRDAIFGVRPALLADFVALPSLDGQTTYSLDINLVLCPAGGARSMPGRSST